MIILITYIYSTKEYERYSQQYWKRINFQWRFFQQCAVVLLLLLLFFSINFLSLEYETSGQKQKQYRRRNRVEKFSFLEGGGGDVGPRQMLFQRENMITFLRKLYGQNRSGGNVKCFAAEYNIWGLNSEYCNRLQLTTIFEG